jgi:spore coat protein U-like protein
MKLRDLLLRAALCALGAAAAIASATPAHAALGCTFTITNIAFGNINLLANTNFDTTGTLTANCTGAVANSTTRVCPNLNAGSGGTTTGNPRFMLNGANQLSYNLYQDAARTTVWGSYLWAFTSFTAPTLNITMNASGAGSGSLTIYGRVNSGQQTDAAGSYISTFSGATHVRISYARSTVGNCAAIASTNATSVTFTVTATFPATCTVASTTLPFGSAGVLTALRDATSTVTATCSSTTPYTIALNGGTTGATDPTQRKMSKGAERITYGLYRDAARTLPWGSTTGTNTASGTGSGVGQAFTVYGRVPAQSTPSAGAYADTIIATVTY